jgi:hypothetical protein
MPASQGHADVSKLVVSPGGAASSAASSPCDSVRSLTLVSNYGSDMNRDLAVMSALEDKLSREVDHCELQACISQFVLVHGHQPTMRQLALALGYTMQDVPAGPGSCSGLDQDAQRVGHSPSPAPSTSPGSRSSRQGSAQRMLGSGSPSARMRSLPVRSLFASDACTPDAPHGRSPLAPLPAEAHPGAQALSLTDLADPAAADQPFTPAPLARPLVPGLNLHTVKKRSPVVRVGCDVLREGGATKAIAAFQVGWGAHALASCSKEAPAWPLWRCWLLRMEHHLNHHGAEGRRPSGIHRSTSPRFAGGRSDCREPRHPPAAGRPCPGFRPAQQQRPGRPQLASHDAAHAAAERMQAARRSSGRVPPGLPHGGGCLRQRQRGRRR